MNRGIATFTLDYGKCPKWLFERMVRLGREMTRVIIAEYGPDEYLRRLSDPVWFQSLGTVLAFDWNASGLTTILTAALKEAIRGEEQDLGIFICGGKGKTSRKTPDEIQNWGNRISFGEEKTNALVYASRMSAKVDSSRYSFAHGGKDATPYPVDRQTYDKTIENMRKLVQKTRIGDVEKRGILQRIAFRV